MKSLSFLMILFTFSVLTAQAQLAVGVKAGVSTSTIEVQNPRNMFMEFKNKDHIAGYHVGTFARLKVAALLVQPEGVFTSSGGRVEVTQTENGQEVKNTEDFKFNRLDVPVLVGFSFFNVARVQAGPVFSKLVSGKFQDQNLKDYMDKSDIGWQAGAGVDIGSLTADLRYERVNRNFTNPAQNSSYKAEKGQLLLSLGWKLLGK